VENLSRKHNSPRRSTLTPQTTATGSQQSRRIVPSPWPDRGSGPQRRTAPLGVTVQLAGRRDQTEELTADLLTRRDRHAAAGVPIQARQFAKHSGPYRRPPRSQERRVPPLAPGARHARAWAVRHRIGRTGRGHSVQNPLIRGRQQRRCGSSVRKRACRRGRQNRGLRLPMNMTAQVGLGKLHIRKPRMTLR
jgi:hypothetical protein